ncbi:MAG: hypothetical protein ACJ762_03060 [Solirubrobacteraceae bacterium]
MSFDDALVLLRGWCGRPVRVALEPEGTRLEGVLAELDAAGVDGALFALDREKLTGVAFALFRDGVDALRREDGELVVRQGRVTVTVTLAG